MAQKPSIPKGTRDFNPEEVAKRSYIVETIKQQFELYGFQPIETPSFENSETLMGKYGEEGDRLIFKILESGEYYEKAKQKIVNPIEDPKTITYLDDLLSTIFKKIKADLKDKCLSNISGDEKYTNMKLISQYLKNNYKVLLNNSPVIIYLGQYEERIQYYLRDNSDNIAIKVVNREAFFEDDIAYERFELNEQKDIQIDLLETLRRFYILNIETNDLTKLISEKALRYDLTVPFARYVVQHQNEIEFPFKRYQIQPVWRADRPQKGRFREFYQCDADVVGSNSLWQDVEFVQLYDAVFTALRLKDVTIKINNRKILSGIAEVIGAQDKLIDFTVALDKLDKIGEEKVKEEMLGKGISKSGIDKLQPLFSLSGRFESQMEQLKSILASSEEGKKGIEELEFINSAISELKLQTASLELDVTLARGLNYYTGAIFEVSAPKGVDMGSIGGGGRYDDLTGIFGLKDVSGVGISFGLDRIYLVLESLHLFPETITNTVKALFINFGESEALTCMKAIKVLRSKNINVELYPDAAKMKKQLNYANKRQIPYTVLVGETELKSNTFTLKNMVSGEQKNVSLESLIKILQ
ncbi:MAG TPA: histidine--tRNA ligase [Flavobacteriaceae bacterium]